MGRLIAFLYGTAAYVVFLAAFLYAIAFTGNLFVDKTIDTGTVGPAGQAILINVLLLGLFAIQHTIMARPGFKRAWTKIIPKSVERSTFVLFASLILLLIFRQWRPMPEVVWDVSGTTLGSVLSALFWVGWVMVLLATFMINHFELFGLQQVLLNLRAKQSETYSFKAPFLYKLVRHPIMLGFLIAFWAAPVMSRGHLLFAVVTSVYIWVGVMFEERDLIAQYGDEYRTYKSRVRGIVPLPKKRA